MFPPIEVRAVFLRRKGSTHFVFEHEGEEIVVPDRYLWGWWKVEGEPSAPQPGDTVMIEVYEPWWVERKRR